MEISHAEYIRKQSEPCTLHLDEGGNIQDSIEEKSYSINALNNKGNHQIEIKVKNKK